jgi:hypothetical protein
VDLRWKTAIKLTGFDIRGISTQVGLEFHDDDTNFYSVFYNPSGFSGSREIASKQFLAYSCRWITEAKAVPCANLLGNLRDEPRYLAVPASRFTSERKQHLAIDPSRVGTPKMFPHILL